MDDEDLLDTLLGIVPPIKVEVDTKTTAKGIARRCFGGYEPPKQHVPTFAVPERVVEVVYDLNTERIHLRAKQKRDDRIKEKKKEK